jgi:hypothetical protein
LIFFLIQIISGWSFWSPFKFLNHLLINKFIPDVFIN